jgi:glycosyltransferase involved in cell wall biosynthesis
MGKSLKPFLLVQIDPPTTEFCGDHYYRTYVPLYALGNRSAHFHTVSLTNEHRLKFYLMRNADVVVLSLVADMDLIPVVEERRKRGLITIYEWNDDVFNVPPWNPQHRFFSQPHVQRTMKQLARMCDAVQFSSTVLEEKYVWLNKKRTVFINHLLPLEEDTTPNSGSEYLEIGYGGSAGHFYDVAYIAPHLFRWIYEEKRVRFNIMAADPIVKLFSFLPLERIRVFPTGSIFDYYRFVRVLHVGIAPLLDTPFNRSRSDVKFLEYAAHGVVPVLQRTVPYSGVVAHGKTGLLFESGEDCISKLRWLLDHPDERKRIAREAKTHVLRERMIFKRIEEREKFYLGLLKKLDLRQKKDDKFFESIRDTEGAVIQGDYVMLGPSRFELLIREGLSFLAEGKRDRARKNFIIAMEMEPANYLPYLYLAECSSYGEEKTRYLREALRINPRSFMARWMLKASSF